MHIVNCVETGICSNQFEHLGVVVTDNSDMELLCPASFCIHHSKIIEHRTAEFLQIHGTRHFACKSSCENILNLLLCIILSIECVHSMIREAASQFFKELVSDSKSLNQV